MAGMTRAFRDLWYKRCTDGSYIQIRGELAGSDNARCCLGVAHEVGVELGLIPAGPCLPNEKGDEVLSGCEEKALGIERQWEFVKENDEKPVPEGQYYPNEVLSLIKAHPVID